MEKLTANNLVAFIDQLDKKAVYNFINPKNHGLIKVVSVEKPEGPIWINRWNPSKGETPSTNKSKTISSEMLWRVANAISANQPFNIDRILGASFNTRSVLEALLAHTPQFHYCYPGRIETTGGLSKIKKGHKHLIWTPNNPHKAGQIKETKTEIVISEVPTLEVVYDSLIYPVDYKQTEMSVDIQRRHSQIQVALYLIGKQLNYRTWIAQNDKGILYQKKRLGELDGVIVSLNNEKLLGSYDEARLAALLIDCIWFKNGKLMPAVMEVEHSTGITSGLTRMKNFQDRFIPLQDVRYVIVAPDEMRDKVIKEANKPQFHSLNTRFFPYSAVEELTALCQKRKIKGVTEEFLDCYMEPVLVK
jgi:type II restriction enzyme